MTQALRGEVIAIGDELISGQRVDTNSQWISQQLQQLGIEVVRHTTIGDDMAENVDAFLAAAKRADIVVTTGGLGPTDDDLTRDALAMAAQASLVEHQDSLDHIEQIFASRGRPMAPQNRRQALFPAGSEPIPNPQGTAPGIDCVLSVENHASRCFSLPGVPSEMKRMWEQSVEGALRAMNPTPETIYHYLVRCFGIGESALESRLPELFARGRTPQVGITATKGTLTLRLVAVDQDEARSLAQLEPTLQTIRQELASLLFAEGPASEGEIDLHDVLLQQLSLRNESLAVVELATCGLLSEWLDKTPDSLEQASPFRHGEVLRSRALDVEQVAADCRIRQGSDHALVTGPVLKSESPDQADRAWVAAATPRRTLRQEVMLPPDRALVRPMLAKHALNLLRLELLE